MTVTRTSRAAALIGAAALGIAVQVSLPCPRGSLLWSAVFDAGHVPLYGLVALAALYASLTFADKPGRPHLWHYVLALVATATLGALTEIAQALGLGDGNIEDFARDLLAGGAFLLAALALDSRMLPRHAGARARRLALVFLAAALLAIAFTPVTRIAIAYLQRDAAFPLICDFEGAWESTFVHARDAELEIGPPPAGWGRGAGDKVAKITFLPAEYPALIINEPYPDWRGYERLVFDVYSERDTTVALALRIDDARHNNEYGDRFNRKLVIQPGANRVVIPLADVERAPRGRTMDMAHVRGVVLFAVRPREKFSVWVDGVRVERE
jgi:hypothetical protein